MATELPSKIGRYEVSGLLGAGAMGNVYLARDPELDRAVAIKTVRYASLPSDSLDTFLERFRNEARAAARLHHPNVVQIFDVGEADTLGPYLVFEYVAGASLKQILRHRGPLRADRVVQLAEEVASALALAHSHGIIHRDIKPDNLLITDEGHAKLADFGVARIPNADLTREGQFLGTPCYAAPETLRSGHYSDATDTFSLASVLYEAATGIRAFPGDDAVAVAHKVIHDEVEPPSYVGPAPRELDAVFERALDKDPSNRFTTASELASALREAFAKAGLVDSLSPRDATVRMRTEVEAAEPDESPMARAAILAGLVAIGIAIAISYQRDTPQPAAVPTVEPSLRDEAPRVVNDRPPRRRRAPADGGTTQAQETPVAPAPTEPRPSPDPTPPAPSEATAAPAPVAPSTDAPSP